MDVLVHNPENIPQEIVEKAIEMMERENGRPVVEISIRRTGEPEESGERCAELVRKVSFNIAGFAGALRRR